MIRAVVRPNNVLFLELQKCDIRCLLEVVVPSQVLKLLLETNSAVLVLFPNKQQRVLAKKCPSETPDFRLRKMASVHSYRICDFSATILPAQGTSPFIVLLTDRLFWEAGRRGRNQ